MTLIKYFDGYASLSKANAIVAKKAGAETATVALLFGDRESITIIDRPMDMPLAIELVDRIIRAWSDSSRSRHVIDVDSIVRDMEVIGRLEKRIKR